MTIKFVLAECSIFREENCSFSSPFDSSRTKQARHILLKFFKEYSIVRREFDLLC